MRARADRKNHGLINFFFSFFFLWIVNVFVLLTNERTRDSSSLLQTCKFIHLSGSFSFFFLPHNCMFSHAKCEESWRAHFVWFTPNKFHARCVTLKTNGQSRNSNMKNKIRSILQTAKFASEIEYFYKCWNFSIRGVTLCIINGHSRPNYEIFQLCRRKKICTGKKARAGVITVDEKFRLNLSESIRKYKNLIYNSSKKYPSCRGVSAYLIIKQFAYRWRFSAQSVYPWLSYYYHFSPPAPFIVALTRNRIASILKPRTAEMLSWLKMLSVPRHTWNVERSRM